MRSFLKAVDRRTAILFVILDFLTFGLVYWLVVPVFDEVLATLDMTSQIAIGHVLTAIRITFIGVIVARSLRGRHGLDARTDAIPSVAVGALIAWILQFVLGVAVALMIGMPAVSWQTPVSLIEWVGFGLLGILFVFPGQADQTPLRLRMAVDNDRGAVSMFLVPAVAGLVVVAVVAITVIGSATNDRRESVTAADAAALAAAQSWRDGLEDAFDEHVGGAEADDFWGLVDLSLATGSSGARAAAIDYAARNGSEAYDYVLDMDRAEVTVWVRNLDSVPQSTKRVTSVATARLDFKSGLCRSGDRLGYLINGTCRTTAPVPEPTPEPTPTPTPSDDDTEDPTPTPSPTPTPPPFEAPSGVGAFKVEVFLTPTP